MKTIRWIALALLCMVLSLPLADQVSAETSDTVWSEWALDIGPPTPSIVSMENTALPAMTGAYVSQCLYRAQQEPRFSGLPLSETSMMDVRSDMDLPLDLRRTKEVSAWRDSLGLRC